MAVRHGAQFSSLLLLALSVALLGGASAQRGAAGSQQSPAASLFEASRGCGAGPYLEQGLTNCVVNEMMGANGTVVYSFAVNPKGPKHALLLTLRSVGGAAVMRLVGQGAGEYDGTVVYFNDAVTESFIRVKSDELAGGQYSLIIQGAGGVTTKMLLYLRVQTPPGKVMLNARDKQAMLSLMRECCPRSVSPYDSPPVCSMHLPKALNAKTPEDDLCNQGPFTCNAQGQLEKIDFSNADLECDAFPAAFGQFPALETLMLRYNSFNGDSFANVAKVLSKSTKLQRLMMGSTNITGPVPCELFEQHKLRTVMFSINKLEGTLPACVLESPSLEELYMSRTTLTGELPDVIPAGSNLRVWYSINQDPETGESLGDGFSGPLPSTLSNAKGLAFLEMSGHQLSGDVPVLPDGMRMFEAFNNRLDGTIASPLPAGLIYFDVMNNSLTGAIPDFAGSGGLTLLDVSLNRLTGELPSSLGPAGDTIAYIDVSNNSLSGPVAPGQVWDRTPQLQFLFAQGNKLEGNVPASLAASTEMTALDLSDNQLSGNLEPFADALTGGRTESPQQAPRGGRRLQSVLPGAVARKLFGGTDDAPSSAAAHSSWRLDASVVRSLAAHQPAAARRQLLQAAADEPQDPPATAALQPDVPAALDLPGAADAPDATAGQLLPVAQEVPAPGGATTTVLSPVGADPAATGPAATGPSAAGVTPSRGPQLPEDVAGVMSPDPTADPAAAVPAATSSQQAAAAAAQQQRTAAAAAQQQQQTVPAATRPSPMAGGQQNDIGSMSVPTRSALAGNSFLYLNVSGNALTGPVPEGLGKLEMFRSPANSSDPYDQYVTHVGSHSRALDVSGNQLYGMFPMFLVGSAPDLQQACRCTTTFEVGGSNFLYCPTKSAMEGVKLTPAAIRALAQQGYTCYTAADKPAVLVSDYVAGGDYIREAPAPSQGLVAPARAVEGSAPRIYGEPAPSSSGGGKLGGGAIAGIVIGVLAGLAILGCLAYFVGYKRFWQAHRATSFKRGQLPDGPTPFDGTGAYPAGAYGAGAGAGGAGLGGPINGFDIETPGRR